MADITAREGYVVLTVDLFKGNVATTIVGAQANIRNNPKISVSSKEFKKSREEVKTYVDDIRTDKMGNLIATKRGAATRIMLAAHMDEIGLMVKYVDEKGFTLSLKI